MPTALSLAVCLFPAVTALDFAGPMELLGFISPSTLAMGPSPVQPAYSIQATYLSVSKEPLTVQSGFEVKPTKAYDEVNEQYDILLVPGGVGTRPKVRPKSLIDFIRKQAPGAKYILSVCTGSEVLAYTGVLQGKRATTNKANFKRIQEQTRDMNITWVPKARWVVDGNIWTSSGVTAGADMSYAFLKHVVGPEVANSARVLAELGIRDEGDDEFAEFYGLV